jgi:hypothetical protein
LKKKSSDPTIGAPSLKSRQLFFMACYDIDTFRNFVESEAFGKLFAMSADERTLILGDDVELLQFSFRFLRQVLFGEQSIALNEEVAKERLKNWQARQAEIEREAAEKRARLDEEMAREGFNEEDSGLGVCDDQGGSCSRD